MTPEEAKAATYGGLLAKSAIFFAEFIDEHGDDFRDAEWVARARELRDRILREVDRPLPAREETRNSR